MKTLMAIGGAASFEEPDIFREFIRRAGGSQARIIILPQASGLKNTGNEYRRLFADLGIRHTPLSLDFRSRADADLPRHIKAVRGASAVFIAGGTKLRLSSVIGGTQLELELHRAFRRGAVIAGTSAGAAILSKIMLAYGKSGATPRERIAQFTQGFGFTDKIVFDQHFRQRDRLGRLAYAVATHPGLLGVGVDENTAAIVENDSKISVIGRGAVTIVDGMKIAHSNVAEATASRPIAISGLQIHILTPGCTFDIQKRVARIPPLALVN
ncbi:MAG: cyanophycinase [Chloroflexi bacterium]|nr:cyanophycinase [Chloroflexota bacterium]